MFKQAFGASMIQQLAAASPRVEARLPSDYKQYVDEGIGFLAGLYLPLAYFYRHDCYSMSLFTAQHFINSHKAFNEVFDIYYNIGYGIDIGVEPIATAFWAWRTITTCSHQAGFWNIKVSTEVQEYEKEIAAVDDSTLYSKLRQFNEWDNTLVPSTPDFGGNIYVDTSAAAGTGVPNILDDLIWWDVGILAVDAAWSAWKIFETYMFGYFFYDQGQYIGKFIGDLVALSLWMVDRKTLTPFWTTTYAIYEAYSTAWDDGTWENGVTVPNQIIDTSQQTDTSG